MKLKLLIATFLLIAVICSNAYPIATDEALPTDFQTRCGWLDNPTPANTWLYDRDGQWIIGVQGGYQLEGDWALPDFKPREWVSTNVGSYGYGCACLRLRVNKQTHEVLEIKSSRARSLESRSSARMADGSTNSACPIRKAGCSRSMSMREAARSIASRRNDARSGGRG